MIFHNYNLMGVRKEIKSNQIILPAFDMDKEDLYIGFFHTGAYQESLGGHGGIQHCLIPASEHILLDIEEDGTLKVKKFAAQQGAQSMLSILGYE